MQGLSFADLQSLLNASEARQAASLGALRESLTDISDKLDRALERSARDDVRIAHLEQRVDELEESAPETNAVARAVKWVGTAVIAAGIGAAANHLDKMFLPLKHTAPSVSTSVPTSPK